MGCNYRSNDTHTIRYSDGEGCNCLAPRTVEVFDTSTDEKIMLSLLGLAAPPEVYEFTNDTEMNDFVEDFLRDPEAEADDVMEALEGTAEDVEFSEIMQAVQQDQKVEQEVVHLPVLKEFNDGW